MDKTEEAAATKNDISVMRKQLVVARDAVQESNQRLTEGLRGAAGTDDQDLVRSLCRDATQVAGSTAALVSVSRLLTLEAGDDALLKTMLTATTTALASMNALADLLSQATGTIDEDGATLQQFVSATKTVDASLTALVSSSADGALIPEGKRLEIQATANAVVRALAKLINSFSGAIQQSIVTEAKVCSCCVASFGALLDDTAISPPFLRKPALRQLLADGATSLKQIYSHFMEQTKVEVSNPTSESAAHMIAVAEPVIVKVRQCVSYVIALSKVDGASPTDEIPTPTPEEVTLAEKVTNVPMPTLHTATSSTSTSSTEGMYMTTLQSNSILIFLMLITDIPPSLAADEEEEVGDDDIWDEPEDSEENIVVVDGNQVKLGKLNKLIERLTSPTVHGIVIMRVSE